MRAILFTLALVCCYQSYADTLINGAIVPIPEVESHNSSLVRLGALLFHDSRLSSDNSISCASCHNLSQGGADNLPVSVGVQGRLGIINTPTVFNSKFNFRQFWNGRAITLHEQLDGPINNPIEMNMGWPEIIARLKKDESYVDLFHENFSDGITESNIKKAIVTFEETLVTPNSRFDQYLFGNSEALNEEEIRGYTLFKEYGCIACHQGVGIGGNMYQKLGIMEPYFQDDVENEADLGRYILTGIEKDKHVFKVPSLRNVALTAPYLHNGKAETLEDVVEVMLRYQVGITAPDEDIKAIVTFLKTLTGEYLGEKL